ncbi:hypothetical protein [Rhizobium sp. WL3]|uniref:hypothetical protein n=1 Tax=Rhizobium sp. WL3 TaxID=2603277 RepID=UPI0032B2C5B6
MFHSTDNRVKEPSINDNRGQNEQGSTFQRTGQQLRRRYASSAGNADLLCAAWRKQPDGTASQTIPWPFRTDVFQYLVMLDDMAESRVVLLAAESLLLLRIAGVEEDGEWGPFFDDMESVFKRLVVADSAGWSAAERQPSDRTWRPIAAP